MFKRWGLVLGVAAAACLAAAWLLPAISPGQAQASTLSGKLVLAGSTSVQPLAEALAEEFMAKNPGVRVQVQGGGSSAGISAAKSGAADIGTSSRELKPDEKGLHEVKVALDGIAVVVHPKNSVKNLTSEQICKIYTGEITNWKQVGGKDAPIMVVTREAGSGTRGAFEELVMQKRSIFTKAIVQGSTGAVRSTVAQAPNSIGYISLGSLDETVKAVSVNGVAASEENVKNKTYKIARPFLFLTRSQPAGLAKAFIDFALGKDGQKIVAEEFVPVSR
ncbi:MAG: phosphate ABC transporter substrate-binding protein [Chitinophagales bacterium]